MRWSSTLIPTLRQSPAEATAVSHELMLRAGMIRRVASGAYTYLPMGLRALRKVTEIVREEMEAAGAVEVLMPVLWPQELMEPTGRREQFAGDLVQFSDRHGRAHLLAPTHEEVVTALARDEVRSYRQLPLTLYQIHTKFRDEPRPRFGIIRTREFVMKDAYSFSMDEASLDRCYERMRRAYERILRRCGLEFACVEAESGAMGGEVSHEFMVPAEIGTGSFVRCTECEYGANVECAEAPGPEPHPAEGPEPEMREVETPGRTTIEDVSEFLEVRPEQMIKTLLYEADGEPVAVLVRGDHDVNENKLRRVLEADSPVLVGRDTIERVTGAPVGFAGPVGLRGVEVVADHAVATVREGVTGANRADAHLVGVLPGRDFQPDRWEDVRFVTAEDPCPRCGGPITAEEGIEVGHIFKLGTKYSEALDATFLDSEGNHRHYVMGCYGIGVNRLLAACAETQADDHGLAWAPSVAPCEALVMPLGADDARISDAAEAAYDALKAVGVDVLLDDRDESPGVKFNDADLIGFPVRVVVGRHYLQSGTLELQVRRTGERTEAAPDEVVAAVKAALSELEG